MDETGPKELPGELPPDTSETPNKDFVESPSEFTMRSVLTLAGSSGIVFCTVGFMNAFGVFETFYAESLLPNESSSNIGWIAAINLFLLFGGSVVTGRILDRSGPIIMLLVGSFLVVLSIMMMSLCKTLWQFILAQGVLLGIGETLLLCPAIALIGQHFKKRLAVAVGCTIGGSSLGGVLWPIIVHSLLESTNVGFGWAMRICGFIMLPILSAACVVTRSPVKAQNSQKAGPKPPWDWSLVMKREMLLTACGFFFVYFGMFMPFFYTTDYALSKGFSSNLSFYTISIVNGASLFGRILPGMVADKYGRFNLIIIMTALAGVIACCWTAVNSIAGLVSFCITYGFTSGAILALQQACAAQISTPTTVGTGVGFVMTSSSLSALSSTPIGGQLIEKYGYLSLSIYSGVSLLVAAALLSVARFSQNRRLLAVV